MLTAVTEQETHQLKAVTSVKKKVFQMSLFFYLEKVSCGFFGQNIHHGPAEMSTVQQLLCRLHLGPGPILCVDYTRVHPKYPVSASSM